jgi:abortive infection bacteriophage resistance protein
MRTLGGYFFGGCVPVYNKPALPIADQLALLEQRGMVVADRAQALFYLTHISYYRLRAYWLPFEDPAAAPAHRFRPNTTFEGVLALYVFDRELRLLVLDAIERIEISFRTSFTQELSLRYGPHAHLDATVFNARFYQACLDSLNDEIGRSREDFIAHYFRRYTAPNSPPLWAATEVMSFGLLSKWFNATLRRQDRQAVASIWRLDEIFVVSFLRHLANIRNFCAHHSRLWNRQFAVTMQMPQGNARLRAMMNGATTNRLHNSLVMLAWLLDIISPGHTWTARVKTLILSMPLVDTTAMGFPADWQQRAPWQ